MQGALDIVFHERHSNFITARSSSLTKQGGRRDAAHHITFPTNKGERRDRDGEPSRLERAVTLLPPQRCGSASID